MKLNAEQIIKALELHSQGAVACLHECPYGNLHNCGSAMARDVLYLIEELTKSNESLRGVKEEYETFIGNHLRTAFDDGYKQGVLDLAKKIKGYYNTLGGETFAPLVAFHIDEKVKEMLEGVITDKNSQE